MKKSKKKLKGMTLVEMIIAIAIFGIMGGLLILVGTHVDATTRAGNTLKNKVNEESYYAANHVTYFSKNDGSKGDFPSEEMDITISLDATGSYYVQKENAVTKKMESVKVDYGPKIEVDLKADKYNTEGVVTDGMTDEQIKKMRERANGGLNLEFFDVRPPEPTT
jgi:prepilin-type N-terminal cleavage/methylation domain-containing protein